MKQFIFKTTGILAIAFLFGIQLFGQNDLLSRFFNNLRNTVVNNAEKLNAWQTDAENAAQKTAKAFTDCPSPAAQNLYNDLTNKLQQAREVKRLADEADRQGQDARDNCKRTTRLNAQCDASYNTLSFKATSAAAAKTITSLERAITVLKGLKCASGCNRTGRIVYPTIQFGERMAKVVDIARIPVPPFGSVPVPYVNEVTYCSSWRRGSFWANWDAGNSEFDADFHLRLPKCEKTNTISVCTEWDLNLLLPRLQKLNIVPPIVSVSDLKVEIPNKNFSLISGVKQVNCNKPIKVARRSTVTLNLEISSNPLSVLTGQGQEMVEIGCAEPAFGLEPISNDVSLPDLTKVRISWKGITVKGGYIEIDMTKPEFQGMCKKGLGSSIKVPTITVGKGYLDLPNVCLQPRFIDLVAKK